MTDLLPADNKVTRMLDSVLSEDPGLANWTGSLSDPALILETSAAIVTESERHVNQVTNNELAIQTVHGPHSMGNLAVAPASMPDVGSSQLPVTSRILLNQLGLVAPDSSLSNNFQVLQLSERFKRNMMLVDKTPGRSVHKIGLIYVREGQELQGEILANSSGSDLYKDFVAGLGWPVDLASHRGYMGGLDKSGTCGNETIYWADSQTEVIFHQVVSMPTHPDDPQQIQKKRHVGNDFVHIIWCEHIRDYNPLTITSRFNEAHIVIYPESNGLFRVQVFRNLVNPLFGPAQHGMLVCKSLLPKIVRETAINADISVSSQFNPETFTQPHLQRLRTLEEAHSRLLAAQSSQGFFRYQQLMFGQQTVLAPAQPATSSAPASTQAPPPSSIPIPVASMPSVQLVSSPPLTHAPPAPASSGRNSLDEYGPMGPVARAPAVIIPAKLPPMPMAPLDIPPPMDLPPMPMAPLDSVPSPKSPPPVTLPPALIRTGSMVPPPKVNSPPLMIPPRSPVGAPPPVSMGLPPAGLPPVQVPIPPPAN